MSNYFRNTSESKQKTALTILGTMHLVITVALGWILAVRLTPPNKPVENGLEMLFPGAVISLLGLPFVFSGLALLQQGAKAAKTALQVDIAAIVAVAGFFVLLPNIWVAFAALPFAVDVFVLLAIIRKP